MRVWETFICINSKKETIIHMIPCINRPKNGQVQCIRRNLIINLIWPLFCEGESESMNHRWFTIIERLPPSNDQITWKLYNTHSNSSDLFHKQFNEPVINREWKKSIPEKLILEISREKSCCWVDVDLYTHDPVIGWPRKFNWSSTSKRTISSVWYFFFNL